MSPSSAVLPSLLLSLLSLPSSSSDSSSSSSSSSAPSLFRVEGKVYPPDQRPRAWFSDTRIVVDGGRKVGFLKEDNTFVVSGLPSGSYLVEVVNPDYFYEPVRVDVNSKGKIRARKVNNVQPTQVTQVSYPLKLKSLGRHHYFQKREEWKVGKEKSRARTHPTNNAFVEHTNRCRKKRVSCAFQLYRLPFCTPPLLVG